MPQGVCWVGLGASLQDDRVIVKARLAEMGPQLLEGPHRWAPSRSGSHPPRTYVAAGPIPKKDPSEKVSQYKALQMCLVF